MFARQVHEGEYGTLHYREVPAFGYGGVCHTLLHISTGWTLMALKCHLIGCGPKRLLSCMANNKYFHGEDNQVIYYIWNKSTILPGESGPNKNKYYLFIMLLTRFCKVEPSRFRVGDIVEVQITVAAVPILKQQVKMISYLRCLALLDGTFTDVSVLYQIWIIIIWLHAQWKLAWLIVWRPLPVQQWWNSPLRGRWDIMQQMMRCQRPETNVNMTMNDREYWFHKVGLENH